MEYKEVSECRICGNRDFEPILDLGEQALTGVFPRSADQQVTSGPLELVKCAEDSSDRSCGLVQLRHTYDFGELYGQDYGYRSGLNPSMVDHLRGKVQTILGFVPLSPGDLVIDIGSNDGTLLGFYPLDGITLVGIDPTGSKFKDYYPDRVQLIPEFFSSSRVKELLGGRNAKIVTSIAMVYDLEDPMQFMREVYDILADDGVWVLEQSYMPTMLEANAYDTICHEHLEYYRLKQIKWMTDRVGFKIVGLEFNDVNGGSYSVMLAKAESPYAERTDLIDRTLADEDARRLGTLAPYEQFTERVHCHRRELRQLVHEINERGERIVGYGASTKGNVILQFCDLTSRDIPLVAEVNEEKFGRVTPGMYIPIIPEAEARAARPDYMIVLPWHFRDFIVRKEQDYLKSGGRLIFPLPSIETVSA